MTGDGWQSTAFGDCAVLVRDTVRPEDVRDAPYIGLEHIAEARLILNGYGRAKEVSSIKSAFKRGDILFGKLRPYFGKVVIAPFDGVCSTDIWVVRAKVGVDQRFLFYWMASADFVEEATRASEGTKMPRAQWEFMACVTRTIPPLSQQRVVGQILGSLDDKIDLNRRMNATLGALARTLFTSWFLDFDPVRARCEGQDTGLPGEIEKLFPDEFEESELGPVPKGWRVGTLREVVGINERSANEDYPYEAIEYVDISSVKKGRLLGTTTYRLSEAPSRARRLVRHGDTIWSTVRPNRESYLFIHNPEDNLVVSTGFAVLTPRLIPPCYLYAWVTREDFVNYLAYSADGSAYPAVLPDRFADAPMLLPPQAVLRAFERQVDPMLDLIAQNERESRTLAALRDALLPKLLSGEIRVKVTKK